MELNTKGRYAVTAMADLAKYGAGDSVPLSAIAERQQISLAYLEQLFSKLRRAGLVESARGRSGGYRLGRPAASITVAEILRAVEEGIRMTRCRGEDAPPCMAGQRCLTHGLWDALGDRISTFLGSVTLQEVLDGIPPVEPDGACADDPRGVDRGMSGERTYLDWNATAPLRPEARAACAAALDVVGNPSSPHAEGRRARAIVEDAREQVAALVGARPAEVVFTSGGTEANNAVLAAGWDTIVLSGIEHDSVLSPSRAGKARIVEMPVGRNGVVRPDRPVAADAISGRILLSLQIANNETGVIQPVTQVAAAAKAQGFFVHTDAVQAAGRIPVDVRALGVDFLTLSAHKIGGPKGIGALVIHERASLPAFIAGGGQERRRRAGTENVAAIAGFGAAAETGRLPMHFIKPLLQHRQLYPSPFAIFLSVAICRKKSLFG